MKNKRKREAYIAYHWKHLSEWLNQCIGCQREGYRPELPQVIYPGALASYVRRYYQPLAVNEQGLCEQCVASWEGPWPYIPFCNTNGQERLVFGARSETGEWPVLDAFHEVGPEEWRELYPSFAALLSAYLASDGQMNTIAGLPNP